jgi:hypothetical protein
MPPDGPGSAALDRVKIHALVCAVLAALMGVRLAAMRPSICPACQMGEVVITQAAYGDVHGCTTASVTTVCAATVGLAAPGPTTASVPEYDRDRFGDGWADADGDCQDTRQEILLRDLVIRHAPPTGAMSPGAYCMATTPGR